MILIAAIIVPQMGLELYEISNGFDESGFFTFVPPKTGVSIITVLETYNAELAARMREEAQHDCQLIQ